MHSSAPAEPPSAPARRVIVYRSSLLAPSETFVLAQALALRRWQPTLVGERRVSGLALPAGLPLLVLGAGRPPAWRALVRRLARWTGRAPVADLRRLRALDARLLHAHFGTDAVDVAPLARALGLPLLVTLHGFDIHMYPQHWASGAEGLGMRSYPARLQALAVRPEVSFVAVSQDVQRQACARLGLAAERVPVLPIGVDLQRFGPGPLPMSARAPRVLFVGRLVPKKGCSLLLQALAQPALRALGAELLVAGDGPLRATLEQEARALGVPARFLGVASPAQVQQALHGSRVLCLPSVTAPSGDAEGFGLVLLEAQASGVPVVSSARGGREDGLLEGVTGFGVAEHDVPALAAALAAVLADPARAQAMGEAGRRFVEAQFDLRHCTAALEEHYDRIAGVAV